MPLDMIDDRGAQRSPARHRVLSPDGLAMIKRFEEFRAEPYDDLNPSVPIMNAAQRIAGTLTIGYGHTGAEARIGNTITEARVALGAVAPTVRLVSEAAEAIIGTTLDEAALAALAAAASAACSPIDDKRGTVAFRKDVSGVLARRAAKLAYTRAMGEKS